MKFYLFGTMRTCFLLQLVLLAVFFFSAPAIQADIITFQYEGELTSVDAPLEGTFSVGDSYSGTYTFDSDTPVNDSFAYFEYPNAIIDMSFNSGNFMASANSGDMSENYFDRETSLFSTDFKSISSSSIAGLDLNTMFLSWNAPYWNAIDGYPSIIDSNPSFNPYSPTPWDTLIKKAIHNLNDPAVLDLNYFDVNGNLVYSYETGVIGNPNQLLFRSNGTPVSNGGLFLRFINTQGQNSRVFGTLNSITRVSNIPSISIPDNKWVQIGLNTAPPTGSTVADIIGDDISASYGSDWVLYSYQTSTNSYKQLSLTDTMLPGIGYWFIQTTGNPVTIDMPSASTGVDVTGDPACTSIPEGCFEIDLQTSNSVDAQWQMIGYPFRDSRNINKVRVVTAGLGSDCVLGCTLKEANEKGLVSEPMYHFDGTSYQQLTTDGSEPFKPWDGAWIATLPSASGQNPKLLIPAAN